MNIEQLDASRILISLSDSDLERMSLSFEKMSLHENNSRRVLRALLESASETTGVSFENKRVFIEAMRYDRGCLLLLTVSDRKGRRKIYRISRSAYSYLFVFSDTDSFFDCMAALYRMNGRRYLSTALQYKKRTLLVIRSMAALKKSTLAAIMEFASHQYRGSVSVASAEEHGVLLAAHNAVDIIGSAFSEVKTIE